MRRAAVLIVRRRRPDGLSEFFLVERAAELRFYGGFLSFPGGRVDGTDRRVPLHSAQDELAEEDRQVLVCAARELFEETGLACFVDSTGKPFEDEAALRPLRDALLAEREESETLYDFLSEHGLRVDANAFLPVTRLRTPDYSKIRFDASYFLVEADRAEPTVIPGELTEGSWWSAADAMSSWRQGTLRIAAPINTILSHFADFPEDIALSHLSAIAPDFEGAGRAISYAPGYELLPLSTPPLPTWTPTTTFLIGEGDFIIVDAGAGTSAGQKHLIDAIEHRLAKGDRAIAIVLTHHHPDHVVALDRLLESWSLPLWGHRRTAERLSRDLDRVLEDGDRIALGKSPDGRNDWELEVLFTPGHADGHIALYDPRHKSIVAADLVSTVVSMYVGYPGGDTHDYIASLERVRALDLNTLYPSHGRPEHEVVELIDRTIRHRLHRAAELEELLDDEPRRPAELAALIYKSPRPEIGQMLRRTVRASLRYLVREGRARDLGGDLFARAAC